MSQYNEKCGGCYYLRDMADDDRFFDSYSIDKGHCVMLKACFYSDEDACHYFKNKDKYDPFWGFYITTAVCDVLCIDKDSSIMHTIKHLRNDIMQNNPKYRTLLDEYDEVGPKIAKELREDQDFELTNGLLNFYIIPTVALVKEKKYDEAIKKYTNLTRSLEELYGIHYDNNARNIEKQKVYVN